MVSTRGTVSSMARWNDGSRYPRSVRHHVRAGRPRPSRLDPDGDAGVAGRTGRSTRRRPATRSTYTVRVSATSASMPNSSASRAVSTSRCTSPYRLTVSSWSGPSSRASMSGSWALSRRTASYSRAAVGRVAGDDHGLEPGRRELPGAVRRVPAAELVPDLRVGEAGHRGDVARDGRGVGRGGAGREGRHPLRAGADRHDGAVTLAVVAVDVVAGGEPSGADPDERRRVAGRVGLDLEHAWRAAVRRRNRRPAAGTSGGRRAGRRRRPPSAPHRRRPGGRVPWPWRGRARRAGRSRSAVAALRRTSAGRRRRTPTAGRRAPRRSSGPCRGATVAERVPVPVGDVERDRVADEGITEGGHGALRRTRRSGRSCWRTPGTGCPAAP